MSQPNTRQLIVTELKKITNGTRHGKPFTLYQVRATHPDGRVIPNMDLRTFEELPLNQVIQVRVSRFDSPRWGTSFTLWWKTEPPKGGQQQQQRPVQQQPQNGNALQQIMARLHRIEQHLGLGQQQQPPAQAPPQQQQQQTAGPPGPPTGQLPPDPIATQPKGDNDIPF